MAATETAYLLTGRPGSGQDDHHQESVARLTIPAGGFYTE